MTEQEIEQFVQKQGEKEPGRTYLLLSSKSADTVIAKVPSSDEASVFRQKVADKEQRGAATEWLVRTCVVHPDPRGQEFAKLMKVKPFLVERWGDKLTEAAGASEEIQVKNL